MKNAVKKLRSAKGFTLIEMLVTILILVILVEATSTGMQTALRIYRESLFQSNSATTAAMLNATLEDMLRYSEKIYLRSTEGTNDNFVRESKTYSASGVDSSVSFLFTNYDYAAYNAYISMTPSASVDGSKSPLRIISLSGSKERNVINAGSFPDMTLRNFSVAFTADGKLFKVHYELVSDYDSNQVRTEDFYVRPLNNR